MRPHELVAARERLGFTQEQLCEALEMKGKHRTGTLRRWESGRVPIPGPVAVAVTLMLRGKRRRVTPDGA